MKFRRILKCSAVPPEGKANIAGHRAKFTVKSFLCGTLLTLTVAGSARAGMVDAGWDYFTTDPGTYVVLGGTKIDLQGYAIGPGNADTIVQRLSNITINDPAGGPIKVTALSLVSAAAFPGLGAPIYISLDPSKLDLDVGNLTINGTSTGGTFTSFFDVFFDITTGPGGTGSLLGSGHETFTTNPDGTWSSTPPAGAVNAGGDFFPTGQTFHVAPDAQHVVSVASIPEISTWAMMLLGFAGIGSMAYRQKRTRAELRLG